LDKKRKELVCITLEFFSEFYLKYWDLSTVRWDLEKNGLGNEIDTPPFRNLFPS